MVSTYAPIDDAKLPSILAGLPEVSVKLGGAPAEWRVREVGDGNSGDAMKKRSTLSRMAQGWC
jgi:hypothetical protein